MWTFIRSEPGKEQPAMRARPWKPMAITVVAAINPNGSD
jgi:hypothetical protein